MIENKVESNRIEAYFEKEDGCCCFILGTIIVFIIAYFIVLGTIGEIGISYFFIIAVIVASIYIILIISDSATYCKICKKRVYPIFIDHICELNIPKKKKYINLLKKIWKNEINMVNDDMKTFININFFKTEKDKRILKSNLISLKVFQLLGLYKYSMVAMGSILEFLLIRYCRNNNIGPNEYTAPDGNITRANKKHFVNYVQSAIENNILNQKKRWEIVQTHLRNFRNYVHINKEVKQDEIDKQWYDTMRPIFDPIYESFKRSKFNKVS